MQTVKPTLTEHLSNHAADVMTEYLEKPVDELDALASLLGMAEFLPENDRFGYDIDSLNAIVLPRIRMLARICRDRVATLKSGEEPEIGPLAD